MNEVIRYSDPDRRQSGSELNPFSRVAIIMQHAERLAEQASVTDQSDISSAAFVRRVMAARAARQRYFGGELFADPAWDILLELYALRCEQRRTSVSKLCVAAAVPTTTALRWLDKLQKDGLIEREPDPCDARRVWVALSDSGFGAMTDYVREVARSVSPL